MLWRLKGLLTSDLAWLSRLRFLVEILLSRFGLTGGSGGPKYYRLKGGGCIGLRPGTTDFKVLEEVLVQQIYGRFTRLLPMGGTILDLGANVGLSAAYLGRASLESRVIAVEPDAGNFRMLVENLRNAGIEHRAIQAFAGGECGFASVQDSGNGAWGIRRGPAADSGVPVIPIPELMDGSGPVSLKCDIEGDERELFAHFAEWEHLVGLIILELHTEFFSRDELFETLQRSEFEWAMHGEIPPDACIALIALERKARKPSETSARLAPLYGESHGESA